MGKFAKLPTRAPRSSNGSVCEVCARKANVRKARNHGVAESISKTHELLRKQARNEAQNRTVETSRLGIRASESGNLALILDRKGFSVWAIDKKIRAIYQLPSNEVKFQARYFSSKNKRCDPCKIMYRRCSCCRHRLVWIRYPTTSRRIRFLRDCSTAQRDRTFSKECRRQWKHQLRLLF